jgi:hypothetical protein
LLAVKKTIIFLSCLLFSIIVCSVGYIIDLNKQKHAYTTRLTTKISLYLDQQQFSLQRLGTKLINPIKQANVLDIAQQLSTYEEIIFALANKGLTVPLSLQLVSLDAQQQIIGSFGELAATNLAIDEEYYSKIVEEPSKLAISKIYTKQEMPDHQMINLGVGIEDNSGNFYGHLDQKLSVSALHEYITQNVTENSELFSFKFDNQNLSKPAVHFNTLACLQAAIIYCALRLLLVGLVLNVGLYVVKTYKKTKKQDQSLLALEQKLQLSNKKLRFADLALDTQNKYGKLLKHANEENQLIDVQQLLIDVKAVNASYALECGVELVFPQYNTEILRFYGQQFRLMQILSGMLHEIICQMSSLGKIELKVRLNQDTHSLQKLEFVFSDNGFYNTLQLRDYELSAADIRCKGWANIYALIEQAEGHLKHIHTAYTGNSITLSIYSKTTTNVISLESYYQDA